jgi:hypothetical protein
MGFFINKKIGGRVGRHLGINIYMVLLKKTLVGGAPCVFKNSFFLTRKTKS